MASASMLASIPDVVPIRRALLSVSDKTGLVDFAKALVAHGAQLVSTGGTAQALRDAGLAVTSIDAVTGFPEMMEGRVKTLHPKVHGGLLGVRTNPQHAAAMREHAIEPIDLVCVNLYPFEATVAKANCTRHDAIENIDIGGPSMLRSAAKNHAFVTVVTDASQYTRVLEQIVAHGGTKLTLRQELAARTFATTAAYDAAIAAHFASDISGEFASGGEALPTRFTPAFVKVSDLRHGENPQQLGALYRGGPSAQHNSAGAPNLTSAKQLHGKELSYNNLLDASAAVELADALAGLAQSNAASCPIGACVMKHTNPCGASVAKSAAHAVKLAIAGDPLAAYGGILAISCPIDEAAAQAIAAKEHFFEVVCAPSFTPEALALLQARWQNVRLLALESWQPARARLQQRSLELRTIAGGALVQSKDTLTTPAHSLQHAAGPNANSEQLQLASFLEVVGRALLSNAVVLGGKAPEGDGLRIFGAGAGQMDRVASCKIAISKAGEHARGATAYSDAFFPFADGPTLLVDAGVTMIVHPGGSKRDSDTFALCNDKQVTCLLTGMRHFRH
jgi:phosphoribosylaminoimidazolecarboxamide formyltransferase/IMP cyclohydrolase